MWGHQSNFVGHGYHFPAFVPPPPFYFPLADGPLSPEEFARQQALARQQELSRRSSSGLPKEQRSRAGTGSHSDSPLSRNKTSAWQVATASPSASSPAKATSPLTASQPPEEECLSLPSSIQNSPVHSRALQANPATDNTLNDETQFQLTISSSSDHQHSNRLADLDLELEASGKLHQPRSPMSSLSGLASWGSLTSSARDQGVDQATSKREILSEPHKPCHNVSGSEQPVIISAPVQKDPPAAAHMRSVDAIQADATETDQSAMPQALCSHDTNAAVRAEFLGPASEDLCKPGPSVMEQPPKLDTMKMSDSARPAQQLPVLQADAAEQALKPAKSTEPGLSDAPKPSSEQPGQTRDASTAVLMLPGTSVQESGSAMPADPPQTQPKTLPQHISSRHRDALQQSSPHQQVAASASNAPADGKQAHFQRLGVVSSSGQQRKEQPPGNESMSMRSSDQQPPAVDSAEQQNGDASLDWQEASDGWSRPNQSPAQPSSSQSQGQLPDDSPAQHLVDMALSKALAGRQRSEQQVSDQQLAETLKEAQHVEEQLDLLGQQTEGKDAVSASIFASGRQPMSPISGQPGQPEGLLGGSVAQNQLPGTTGLLHERHREQDGRHQPPRGLPDSAAAGCGKLQLLPGMGSGNNMHWKEQPRVMHRLVQQDHAERPAAVMPGPVDSDSPKLSENGACNQKSMLGLVDASCPASLDGAGQHQLHKISQSRRGNGLPVLPADEVGMPKIQGILPARALEALGLSCHPDTIQHSRAIHQSANADLDTSSRFGAQQAPPQNLDAPTPAGSHDNQYPQPDHHTPAFPETQTPIPSIVSEQQAHEGPPILGPNALSPHGPVDTAQHSRGMQGSVPCDQPISRAVAMQLAHGQPQDLFLSGLGSIGQQADSQRSEDMPGIALADRQMEVPRTVPMRFGHEPLQDSFMAGLGPGPAHLGDTIQHSIIQGVQELGADGHTSTEVDQPMSREAAMQLAAGMQQMTSSIHCLTEQLGCMQQLLAPFLQMHGLPLPAPPAAGAPSSPATTSAIAAAGSFASVIPKYCHAKAPLAGSAACSAPQQLAACQQGILRGTSEQGAQHGPAADQALLAAAVPSTDNHVVGPLVQNEPKRRRLNVAAQPFKPHCHAQ
ncbi:hypothetical protein WJX74_000304 [Apatococcus lobatus]|uniref:Uncharacterized protein n=1 Tax=Apatococcus lobatus TaxID=904363 RepID=A0AAW1SF92_9CHLO